MNCMNVTKDGETVRVYSQWIGEVLWVHYEGKTQSIVREKNLRRVQDQDLGNEVLAPMPGKVLKVNVQQGDVVEKGQTLVVMEAMKMEYSLEAPCSGTVMSVNCSVEDQVTPGAVLVDLEVTVS